ncbi:flagellar biosynthetic protein FliR [Paraglaciecola sp.]|nr:flagellar biosynthetic protein FliR [Paraglaciecola sp.]MDB4281762.1 flagellar biosynthetic protein FliR [Paraglaciecola sp.]
MLPISVEVILNSMVLWAAPFLRLSAMFIVAPVFSAAGLNVRTRVLMAVLIAALVAPVLPPPPVQTLFSGAGLLMAVREIGVGITIGFVLQLAFASVVIAGQSVAMTMGLGFAMSVDPQNGVQVPVVSQFNVIMATLLFLALDGHLVLIATVVESYNVMPASVAGLPATSFVNVVGLGSQIYAAGLLLALPALTALLLVNISFGVMTRAAPQLNIFAVGFPLTITAGFIMLFLAMPGFINVLTRLFNDALSQTLLVFG